MILTRRPGNNGVHVWSERTVPDGSNRSRGATEFVVLKEGDNVTRKLLTECKDGDLEAAITFLKDANESGTKYVETFSLSEDPTFHSIGTGAVWSDVPKALKCSDKSTILAITANGPRDFKDYFNGDFYGGTTVVSVVAADKSHTLVKVRKNPKSSGKPKDEKNRGMGMGILLFDSLVDPNVHTQDYQLNAQGNFVDLQFCPAPELLFAALDKNDGGKPISPKKPRLSIRNRLRRKTTNVSKTDLNIGDVTTPSQEHEAMDFEKEFIGSKFITVYPALSDDGKRISKVSDTMPTPSSKDGIGFTEIVNHVNDLEQKGWLNKMTSEEGLNPEIEEFSGNQQSNIRVLERDQSGNYKEIKSQEVKSEELNQDLSRRAQSGSVIIICHKTVSAKRRHTKPSSPSL
eukprot:GHVU01106657.1.p1 GENE.GHVU01106657.1~~GHVU01106657.1.p1  ORF type:complete len:402 (-),score=40.07 GHVU01106657.1:156-1361(-)